MGKERTKIRFQDEHIQIFSALSFDTNPLHLDPDYSRATPYGEPVVFGMAATLSALSHWSEGKAFSLGMIRGVFLKPIFRLVVPTCLSCSRIKRTVPFATRKSVLLQKVAGAVVENVISFADQCGVFEFEV